MDIWRNRAVACLLALLMPLAAAQPLLVLDSGHTPSKGGALGTRGEYEVVYNDRFVSGLKSCRGYPFEGALVSTFIKNRA